MPAFPPCPPDVPEVLNPLNPRHYWLLFTWIYFRPSRLKHYLYRADPDLYTATGRAFFMTLRLPAYRNLYVMSLILTAALSIGVAWVSSARGTPMRWGGPALGVAVGVALGVAGGVAGGVAFGLAGGVALGMAGGVAGAVALGMAGGVALGAAVGVAVGVALGVAIGVAFGVAIGVAVGVAVGVTVGVTVGVAGGVAGGAGGSRLVFYLLEWPLAWWLSRTTKNPLVRLKRHPAVWDEMAVWPLSGTDRLLIACLSADLDRSLELAAQIAANPFQRWAVQRALSDFLAGHADPLWAWYHLAQAPALGDYLIVPVDRRQFRDYPSALPVLLGEVGQGFVDGTGGVSESSERWVWRLSRRWRRMTPTSLSRFGEMLYVLFDTEDALSAIEIKKVARALKQLGPYFDGVRELEHGSEVADSFGAIAAFLEAEALNDLVRARVILDWVNRLPETLLRPTVVEALRALGDVSEDVAACGRATSAGRKSAALNRAAGALNELAGYVEKEVLPPERVLLKRVVDHWQSIVAEAQGKLGEAALREMTPAMRRADGIVDRVSTIWQRPVRPLDNPYVVGNPVSPPLFTGRTDVFNRISEVWSAKAVPDSIIVYGHRRMGKSSILRNLDQAAPSGNVIVYVDMQGETAFVESTADLLLGVADRIHAAVRRAHPDADLPQPDLALFTTSASAQREFNRFTDRVRDVLKGHTLILAVDEFEAVERAVEAGKIGREIYQFVRSKTQEPWVTLVLGGLHTLDEMSRDYQQPFYGSYENIRVSYLSHDDAWHLITNPTLDFALNYGPEAVERIIAETGRQPYLIQQICRDALDHLNHELFDEHKERDVLITLADVEAVLGPDFFQRGTVYFDGVWTQASAPEQRNLLRAMAQRDGPWTLAELEAVTQLSSDTLHRALRWAERHDILQKLTTGPPAWQFYVPLMRRWVNERAPV